MHRVTKMQWLYLILAILGTALPVSYLARFIAAYGLDVRLFFSQLFQTDVSSFFAMDVLVSVPVLLLLVFSEGRRLGMKRLWAYLICSLLVGVSMGLPLFLFFRERRLNVTKRLAMSFSIQGR